MQKKRLEVHVGYRIPAALQAKVLAYAVRHQLTASEAVRRLLEISLKTSQRA